MIILASRLASDFGPRHGRRGDGFGHPGLFVFGLLLLTGVVIAGVALWRGRQQPPVSGNQPSGPQAWGPAAAAEAILSERFARGEVSVDDFVIARSALRGEWVPPRQTVSADAGPAPTEPAPTGPGN